MELKKNPKADLQRRRTLFLEIGLVFAIGICIIAFAVNQKDKVIEIPDLGGVGDEIELIDITIERPKEVEPVRKTVAVITDILNVVKNDTQIDSEIDFTEFEENFNDLVFNTNDEVIQEEEIFLRAEKMPSFMGGDLNTFRNWVQREYRYPSIALENGIQGRVILQFVVEKDGRVTNIEVLQTADPLLSNEAKRVVETSPKWAPGMQRDMPVRIRYTLPMEFKIQN